MTTDKLMSKRPGLFLVMPSGEPHFNMACDNRLFEMLVKNEGEHDFVLRLYSWQSPAITIGHNQDAGRVVIWDELPPGVPVIRRITGGRAIYHDESEITFSLMARSSAFPSGKSSLTQSSLLISEILEEIVRNLGIKAEYAPRGDAIYAEHLHKSGRSCFDSISKYEIMGDKRKLIGGAQRRHGENLIYQGAVKINGVSDCRAIGQTGTAEQSGGYGMARLAPLFQDIFGMRLGIDFEAGELHSAQRLDIGRAAENLRYTPLVKKEFC